MEQINVETDVGTNTKGEELVAVEAVVMKPAMKPARRRLIRDHQISEPGWPTMVIRLTEVRQPDAPFSDVEVMWLGAVMGPNGEVEAPRWGKLEASSLPIAGVDPQRVSAALKEAQELQEAFEARARNGGLDKEMPRTRLRGLEKAAKISPTPPAAQSEVDDLQRTAREMALKAENEKLTCDLLRLNQERENELYTLEEAWELIKSWREEALHAGRSNRVLKEIERDLREVADLLEAAAKDA